MLSLYNVTMRFGSTLAVDSVNLEIPKGQMVGIIGRSGAGKSTLLRMVNRLIDPTDGAASGKIDSDGLQVHALRGPALRRWRASCAMIFQQFNLVGRLEVVTNVLVGRLAHRGLIPSLFKRFSAEERAAAVRALDRLDMAEFALRRAESLSGGQQQRVAIARAMVQEPRLLLADEPVASLDPRSAAQVMDALRRVCDEDGVTVICNLHHLDYARRYCDRVIGMAGGKVVFDGRPDALDAAAVRQVYGDGIEEAEGVAPAEARTDRARKGTAVPGAPLDAPALAC